jgi:WD40 repeat protein
LFVAIFFLSLDIPAAAGQSSTSPTLTLQTGQTAEAVSIAINPDGRQLAAGNAHAITFWDRQNGWILKSLTGHSGNINSVVFSPDGNWLASGSDNGEIAFWNSKTSDREALKSVNKSAIACAFIPEVERCHSFCCVGQHYRLWDDGACQNSCVLTTTSELPSTMVISADESWLAVGTDHWVHVWKLDLSDRSLKQYEDLKISDSDLGDRIAVAFADSKLVAVNFKGTVLMQSVVPVFAY